MDTPFISDIDRLGYFIGLLPRELFLDGYLGSLWYGNNPRRYADSVSKELKQSKDYFYKFDNKSTNQGYELFNEKLGVLIDFTDKKFPSEEYTDSYRGVDIILSEDELVELQGLVTEVRKTYEDFLDIARAELLGGRAQPTNVTEIPSAAKSSDVAVGPLSYQDGVMYYKGNIIENLTPQAHKLGGFFLSNRPNWTHSYKKLGEAISEDSDGDNVSKGNIQRLISKLRNGLRIATKQKLIKTLSGSGYSFDPTNLR